MRELDWQRDGSSWPTARGSRFADTPSGRFLVYQGGREGPELLLLHGVAGSVHCWAPILPLLERHFRVTALDLPGHGFSHLPPDDRLTLEGMSTEIEELLHLLGVVPEIAGGHSAGAGIAMSMILDGRLSPRSFVGINPSLVPPSNMPLPPILEAMARPFVRSGALAELWAMFGRRRWIVDQLLQSTGSSISEAQKVCYRKIARSPAQVHAALTMMTSWKAESLSEGFARLHSLVERIILIAGERDRWIPTAEIEKVAARIPGSELRRVAAGHLAPEESPEAVASIIVEG
jgi:magnesium chelatase accessory protein